MFGRSRNSVVDFPIFKCSHTLMGQNKILIQATQRSNSVEHGFAHLGNLNSKHLREKALLDH